MATLLQKIDQERTLEASRESTEVAKICRVTLAKDSPRPLELRWCQGRGFKDTLLVVKPGGSVDQPLDKCHAWFGPFDLFKVYLETRDEKTLEMLRNHIATESARYLNRYDYERAGGEGYKPKMNPTAPHRSPDVTITVMNADGTTDEPVRLYQVYGIGEFDDLQFAPKETEEQIRARFESQLLAKDAEHRSEVEALRRDVAQVTGIVKGFVAAKQPAAKAAAPKEMVVA